MPRYDQPVHQLQCPAGHGRRVRSADTYAPAREVERDPVAGYRGPDKASAEAEADMCAMQLFKLLRERDVNGLGRSRGRERGLVKCEKVKGSP
jgi:hypothetical protein